MQFEHLQNILQKCPSGGIKISPEAALRKLRICDGKIKTWEQSIPLKNMTASTSVEVKLEKGVL